MMQGRLSYEQFCVEAEVLQKKSHEVARTQRVTTWEWRHGDRQHLDGDSYLVSIGNVRLYEDGKEEMRGPDGEGIDELLMVEEVAVDESIEDDVETTLQCKAVKAALLEFHIVYHVIYQTPVLYFRAVAVDGTPLPADIVTCGVQFPGSNGHPTFVAMEEHPVTGKPFSFLHPCETAAAMQLLQAQVQYDSTTETPPGLKMAQYLASWLSLVQPLTRISPVDYFRY